MKARKVKGLDPAAPLGDNAERIVRVRLDELCSFMPRAADPAEVEALHDMRIAAKRLRYILEITHPCFGPYAEAAVKCVKELQEVLGEIHDCDVQLPEVRAFLDELVVADAEALLDGASRSAAPRRLRGPGRADRGAARPPRARVPGVPRAVAGARAQGLPRAPRVRHL